MKTTGEIIQELDLAPHRWKSFTSGPESLVLPSDIQKAYESGQAGAIYNPAAMEELASLSPFGSAIGVLDSFGSDVDVKGKLIYPFHHVMMTYPDIHPGPAQQVGDCVSQDSMRACLLAMVMDAVLGEPDPITGLIESPPELTREQILQAGFSTEAQYWFRGHGGHGWSCGEAATVSVKNAGLVIRERLSDGTDLSKYSGRSASAYGRQAPGSELRDLLDNNLMQDAVRVENEPYVLGSMLARGAGISSCGSDSFADMTPDWPDADGEAAGPSRRTGNKWAHSMAVVGADFRSETITKWNEPLFILLQTWGRWGSGPRRLHNSQMRLPYGSFLARWSDIKRRTFIAKSGCNGWKAKTLLDMSPHQAGWGY